MAATIHFSIRTLLRIQRQWMQRKKSRLEIDW